MNKIVIINGHPDINSFCRKISEMYQKGALKAGSIVKIIHLAELSFNPNLEFGYKKRTDLEPCLLDALSAIKEANHLVFVYPNWWGTYPALLKGFIDRVFLPGHVFANRENSILWDKLLKGKTAHLFVTMDTPKWYYWLVYHKPGDNAMRKSVLQFCGISRVRITHFTPIKRSSEANRIKWLEKTEKTGFKGM